MKIEDILKVKFLKIDEKFESDDYTVVESNIEANSLVELLTKIESQNGIGKSIHEEAFTGIDYQGNKVKFCSYLVWTKDEKIYKYNFDENFIPLNQSNKTVEVFTKEDIEKIKNDANDKYLRLLAEFDNYKRRINKEKEDLKLSVKSNMLSAILDLDSDLALAKKSGKIDEVGLNLIVQKVEFFLKNQDIETIQTETYDPDLHEVISVLEIGEDKIIDVISKGYMIGGKPFRYPKIILGRKKSSEN